MKQTTLISRIQGDAVARPFLPWRLPKTGVTVEQNFTPGFLAGLRFHGVVVV